ncbi:MAG: hypothetical protein R2865_02265 [Deinococcales bacterium]
MDKASVRVGEMVNYRITVRNLGQSTGSFELVDALNSGLIGQNLKETAQLAGGQSRVFTLSAQIGENAPDVLENCAVLKSNVGNLQDCVSIVVSRPLDPTKLVLIKEVSPAFAKVGDIVTFSLTARNDSDAEREFNLIDRLPAYLEGRDLDENFSLAAGASRSFRISARVKEGAPEQITNSATLSSEGHSATSTATVHIVKPVEVPPPPAPPAAPPSFSIRKRAMQEVVEAGKPANFLIHIVNSGGQAGQVSFEDILPAGLVGTSLRDTFSLAPGEARDIPLTATVSDDAPDSITNTACIRSAEAGEQCASATIVVIHPKAALPEFKQERYSDIDLQFGSEGHADWIDRVLISHMPPVGSRYVPGSSRLNGILTDDPLVGPDGRLYWVLGMLSEGEIHYRVNHTGALAPVEDPTFTLRTATGETMVAGNVSMTILDSLGFQESVIAPKTRAGDLEIISYQLNVGNRQPIEVAIQVPLAMRGMVDHVTVGSNLEPIDPDASTISGYQVAIDANGRGVLRFEPQATIKSLNLELLYNDKVVQTSIGLLGSHEGFFQYHISATARLLGGDLFADIFAAGYLEMPLGPGMLQAALDIGIDPLNFGFDTNRGLMRREDPITRFALTGSGNEARAPLTSQDGIALRYDAPGLSVGYADVTQEIPGVGITPNTTGAFVSTQGPLQVTGFAGLASAQTRRIVFSDKAPYVLDGSRMYSLGEAVNPSSERVTLVTVEGSKTLQRLKDYTIDYVTGLITFAEPLASTDKNFNPVMVEIEYAPSSAPRDQLVYAAGASYTAGSFSFGAGFANLGSGLEIGAQAAYNVENFGVLVSYKGELLNGAGRNNIFGIKAKGSSQAFDALIDLSYKESTRQLTGRGRLAYKLGFGGVIALEHLGGIKDNRSALLYEHRFGNLGVGAGLGYSWENAVLLGLVRGLYQTDTFSASLTHTQPFSNREQPRTDVSLAYQIDENLAASAVLYYIWGNELAGKLGLEQRIYGANLILDYELPTLSGGGNRARLGIEAPLELNENTNVTLSGNVRYNLTGTEDNPAGLETSLGVGIRYQNEGLNASLATEVVLPVTRAMKITLRGGVSGQISQDQTISLSANYQLLPQLTGRATLSYALKLQRLNLLTYHSLVSTRDSSGKAQNLLEGEIAPTYYVSDSFQLRSSAAYRLNFNDPKATTFQLSLGAIYYTDIALAGFKPTLGLGAYGHYLLQPGTGAGRFGASVELRLKSSKSFGSPWGIPLMALAALPPIPVVVFMQVLISSGAISSSF